MKLSSQVVKLFSGIPWSGNVVCSRSLQGWLPLYTEDRRDASARMTMQQKARSFCTKDDVQKIPRAMLVLNPTTAPYNVFAPADAEVEVGRYLDARNIRQQTIGCFSCRFKL